MSPAAESVRPAVTRLRARDVAEYAGVNLCTVYDATRRGDLVGRPPRGQTRPILYRVEDVERWLDGEGGDES